MCWNLVSKPIRLYIISPDLSDGDKFTFLALELLVSFARQGLAFAIVIEIVLFELCPCLLCSVSSMGPFRDSVGLIVQS